MRLYSNKSASDEILRYGRRLKKGLERVEQTRSLAGTGDDVQAGLAEAQAKTKSLEAPLDDASDDLKFAELAAEGRVRRLWNQTREWDGDRSGPITRVGFPGGLTPVIGPKGEGQKKALKKLRAAYADSKAPEVVARQAEIVAACDEALALFMPAYDKWEKAQEVYDAAFAVEKLRRTEHRRTMDAILGGIREALPGDRRLQDAIVPRVEEPTKGDDASGPGTDDAGGGTGGGDGGGGGGGGGGGTT